MTETEVPNFIGGPMCGTEVPPVPIGQLHDDIVYSGGGTYQRLAVVPAWLVDAPFKVGRPIYLWHEVYHDAHPKPKPPKETA